MPKFAKPETQAEKLAKKIQKGKTFDLEDLRGVGSDDLIFSV